MLLSLTYYILLPLLAVLYIWGLISLSRGFGRICRAENTTAQQQRVSVIICAYNEQKNIYDCLRNLSIQDYPRRLTEFIIVDDRSTDKTGLIIDEFVKKDRRFRKIKIVDRIEDMAPKKRAIDMAIKQASGDIILLSDADGRPGRKWISAMMAWFTEQTDMVLGYAPYTVKPANHIPKQLLALEYLSHAAVAAASTGLGYPLTCVGTNMAYRKQVYQEIGGFGEFRRFLSGDDDLFLTRVRQAGRYRFQYACSADCHVFNNPPQLWSKFIHQRMRYASKGFNYPFHVTMILIALFLFNLLLFAGLPLGFARWEIFLTTLIILALKWSAEFLFMYRGATVLNDRRYLKWFPVAAVFHIPYVIVFGILGQFRKFRWSDDHVESAVQNSSS